jgi:hypothetical protein
MDMQTVPSGGTVAGLALPFEYRNLPCLTSNGYVKTPAALDAALAKSAVLKPQSEQLDCAG